MQRFTVYTDVLTSHSNFLKAARKREWIADPTQPVDLKDADPRVFSRYFNYVYFGAQALQPNDKPAKDDRDYAENPCTSPDAFDISLEEQEAQWRKENLEPASYSGYLNEHFGVLVELYLLADRLQDVQTANAVIDEIVRFGGREQENPNSPIVFLIYAATVHGNPLRKWARDTQVYETSSKRHLLLHVGDYPADFMRDVAVELMRIRDSEDCDSKALRAWGTNEMADKCRYHLHDKQHPRCVPEPGKEREVVPE